MSSILPSNSDSVIISCYGAKKEIKTCLIDRFFDAGRFTNKYIYRGDYFRLFSRVIEALFEGNVSCAAVLIIRELMCIKDPLIVLKNLLLSILDLGILSRYGYFAIGTLIHHESLIQLGYRSELNVFEKLNVYEGYHSYTRRYIESMST